MSQNNKRLFEPVDRRPRADDEGGLRDVRPAGSAASAVIPITKTVPPTTSGTHHKPIFFACMDVSLSLGCWISE